MGEVGGGGTRLLYYLMIEWVMKVTVFCSESSIFKVTIKIQSDSCIGTALQKYLPKPVIQTYAAMNTLMAL